MKNGEYGHLNYYNICMLLFIIKDDLQFSNIKDNIITEIIKRIKQEQNPMRKSEFVLLYFDLLVCPYINKSIKVDIIEIVRKVSKSGAYRVLTKVNKTKCWFFNWNSINLNSYLMKKEYKPAYESF